MKVPGQLAAQTLDDYLESTLSSNSVWADICRQSDATTAPFTASTPREILQQPWVWGECGRIVAGRFASLATCLDGVAHVYLTGAGSSFLVGKSLETCLRERVGKRVVAVASTDLILAPEAHLERGEPSLIISFSRSGGSPESFELARTISQFPEYRQLLITCNGSSPLAQMYSDTPNSSVLALHPASCDQGLAMTSSFTSMVIAAQALGFLGSRDAYLEHVSMLCDLGSHLLGRAVRACEGVDWNDIHRGCLLANGDLQGSAMEGALKMLEMTDGRIATISNSFLGVRHGPLSFLDPHTLVLYFISTQSRWRRYEQDLIKEVQNKELAGYRIAIGPDLADCEGLVEERIEIPVSPNGLADDLRPPLDVLVPQVLALRLGLAAGLNPDNPSRRGAISRVVQGVTIHGVSGT